MLNGNYFRDQLENIIDNTDSYSREELHAALMEITERYLNELISTLNYETVIIASLGEEEGSKVIEKAATADPAINELGLINAEESDKREVIRNLLNFVESQYNTRFGGDDDAGHKNKYQEVPGHDERAERQQDRRTDDNGG